MPVPRGVRPSPRLQGPNPRGQGRAGAAVHHTGQHEKSEIRPDRRIQRFCFFEIPDAGKCRERRVGPAVPEDQFAPEVAERAQVRVRRVHELRNKSGILFPGREIILAVVPSGITEYDVFEELGPKSPLEAWDPLCFELPFRDAGYPGSPPPDRDFHRRKAALNR